MKRNWKKPALILLLTMMILSVNVTGTTAADAGTVKNVILLIPDGMSVTDTTLARWYQGGAPLALDEMACGLVRTYSADAAIADSAPAGTAYATGYKSHTGFVGVLPDAATMPGLPPIAKGDERKPIATILEAAELAGMSTGIVVTCEFPHATPADFMAHYPDRKNYDDISEQQVYSGVDVLLGGGAKFLAPDARKDKENLLDALKGMGYDYLTTPAEMNASASDKLWGMFAPVDMNYDFDRDPAKQPSLAEMTAQAIKVLAKDPEGFFLMVEGSKIDWAAHANAPVGVISDTLAFDKAVKAALDFAKTDKHTVVIAVTDHGNGGLTIGNKSTDSTYDKEPLATFISSLTKVKLTGEGLESKFNADRSNIQEVAATYLGITDLTDEEIQAIKTAPAGKMLDCIGQINSRRAHLGWTTGGHTGEDVVLYIYSPNNDRPTGVIENTDVAKYMERVLGLDLDAATSQLFVPARAAFEAKGAQVAWDDSAAANPVLVITKGSDTLKLPVNKNTAELNGRTMVLNGRTIFNGAQTFVPQDAVDLIN